MSEFSNRAEDAVAALPTRQSVRAAADRAIAELDRLMALPAGHPDILRAWGADQRAPVPVWFDELLCALEEPPK